MTLLRCITCHQSPHFFVTTHLLENKSARALFFSFLLVTGSEKKSLESFFITYIFLFSVFPEYVPTKFRPAVIYSHPVLLGETEVCSHTSSHNLRSHE